MAPFSADETALVETFAAQAVIAIENVRQFQELQIRLEREAATREVLQVISQSRDDEHPVFDAILKTAAWLCNSPMAHLQMVDNALGCLGIAAHWGDPLTAYQPGVSMNPLEGDHASARVIREKRVIHVADLADDDVYRNRNPVRVTRVEEKGVRTDQRTVSVIFLSPGFTLVGGLGISLYFGHANSPKGVEQCVKFNILDCVLLLSFCSLLRPLHPQLNRPKNGVRLPCMWSH